MNCEFAETTVHGYFDGELDAVRSAEFERHLERCVECQRTLESMESLRTRIRHADLSERASPALRDRIRKDLAGTPEKAAPRRVFHPGRFLVPAFGLAAAGLMIALGLGWIQRSSRTTQITAELVDAHVRSLQPGHLADVQSTDQHTVKPWFDGKLDFIPSVSDYAEQGFPLTGGRLDVIDGHTVAAMSYGRRKHIINLFVWPAARESLPDTSGSRQGYNWMAWRAGEMQFCLVSDVSAGDLGELKRLMLAR